MTATIDHTTMTREVCKACWAINSVGFSVPDAVWNTVVPARLQAGVVCLACFARFGDERLIAWDRAIEFFPVSLATHQGVGACDRHEGTACEQAVAPGSGPDITNHKSEDNTDANEYNKIATHAMTAGGLTTHGGDDGHENHRSV